MCDGYQISLAILYDMLQKGQLGGLHHTSDMDTIPIEKLGMQKSDTL